MGHTVIVLVIYLLAVMRLVRLINSDTVLDPARLAVARRIVDTTRPDFTRKLWGGVQEFTSCPWCVGMWLAVLTAPVPVVMLGWPVWSALPLGLACSQLVGMFAPLFNDDEIEFEPVQAG